MINSWCVKIPTHPTRCSECSREWDRASDATGVMSYTEDKYINLAHFIGKTLHEVLLYFASRSDGVYTLEPFWSIVNERLISEGKMFRRKDSGIDEDYIVQEGDVASVRIHRYAHFDCNRVRLTAEGRESFAGLFQKAGFVRVFFESVNHGHFPVVTAMHTWPWYRAHTEVGIIRVGWQARILNINWKDATGDDLEHLFRDETVTKGPHEVHANDETQGINFLRRVRQHLIS